MEGEARNLLSLLTQPLTSNIDWIFIHHHEFKCIHLRLHREEKAIIKFNKSTSENCKKMIVLEQVRLMYP